MRNQSGAHIFGLVLSIVALSGSAGMQEGETCASAMTTREMESCFDQKVGDRESSISKILVQIRPLLSDSQRTELSKSQQEWEEYKNSACRAVYNLYDEGSIRSVATAGCKLLITENRERELKTLYGDAFPDGLAQ